MDGERSDHNILDNLSFDGIINPSFAMQKEVDKLQLSNIADKENE